MKSENKTSKTKIQINKEKLPNCIFDIFNVIVLSMSNFNSVSLNNFK